MKRWIAFVPILALAVFLLLPGFTGAAGVKSQPDVKPTAPPANAQMSVVPVQHSVNLTSKPVTNPIKDRAAVLADATRQLTAQQGDRTATLHPDKSGLQRNAVQRQGHSFNKAAEMARLQAAQHEGRDLGKAPGSYAFWVEQRVGKAEKGDSPLSSRQQQGTPKPDANHRKATVTPGNTVDKSDLSSRIETSQHAGSAANKTKSDNHVQVMQQQGKVVDKSGGRLTTQQGPGDSVDKSNPANRIEAIQQPGQSVDKSQQALRASQPGNIQVDKAAEAGITGYHAQGHEADKSTSNELDEIPGFYNVYVVGDISPDFDAYLEGWYFEVDVDVPNGATESTSITITDTQGNNYGTYGPTEFTGYLTSDNYFIGPFADRMINWSTLPADVEFVFTLDNGGDTFNLTVPVDDNWEDMSAPFFYSVGYDYFYDNDSDGYYESWGFMVDIDIPDGGTQDVSFRIYDSLGNDYGWFGPYTFTDGLVSDNVTIDASAADIPGLVPPENVFFYFEIEADGDGWVRRVPIDEPAVTNPPFFWDVYTVAETDVDTDGWWESWWFEVDVDVPNMETASTEIHVTDSNGNDYGWFGPFDFYDGATDDNVFIGPFSSTAANAPGPPDEMVFNFELSNGGDTATEVVPADAAADDHGPMSIWSVYTTNTVDTDSDGWFESWDFEVDADVSDGGTAQTWISIIDNYGNDYGTFGPFNFTGTLVTDNAMISGFTSDMIGSPNLPEDVTFTFFLTNGGATYDKVVPVDDVANEPPYFYDVYTDGGTDVDSDGYLESWWFQIDVDVPNMGTDQTSIILYGPDGSVFDTYGPFSFYDGATNDNVYIGPFNANMFPGGPGTFEFTFELTNGGDLISEFVDVDDAASNPGPMEIYEVYMNNAVDSDTDGYWDSWDFEVDADVLDGGTAQTYIIIWTNTGEWSDTFGPFDFTGFATDDNAFLTGFTWDMVNPSGTPQDITFSFMLSNGGYQADYIYPIDGQDVVDVPFFWSVWGVDYTDEDSDGFWDSWYYEIDVDVPNGAIAETNIMIYDDMGAINEVYGPFTFEDGLTADNVIIGPFFASEFAPYYGLPNEVPVTFELTNGGDTYTHWTPMDGEGTIAPYIYSVYSAGPVDTDADGYFESWYFEVDVDAPGGTADTEIHITNQMGDDYGWFGPFTFNGYDTWDNAFIGVFSSDMVSIDAASDVEFTFELSNGGDTATYVVPVDNPVVAETPFIWSVTPQNLVDIDSDGFYESWDFEIDVDVPNMGTASTTIHIWDDTGNDYGVFGPFTFYDGATDDNVWIGTFTSDIVNLPTPPQEVTFYVELQNGGDQVTSVVPVDEPTMTDAPFFYGVYVSDWADTDNDGFLESWYFEIDVDVPGGGIAETSISIVDDRGDDFGSFGPFTFEDGLVTDNVFIGPFTQEMITGGGLPGYVDFTMTLSNGGDTVIPSVPVDGAGDTFPFFWDVYTVDVIDADMDGYFEAWNFEIDVDVPGGGIADTEIQITDSEGNDYGWYGPFTFEDGATWDNVFIGLWTAELVNPATPPTDVEFYFTLSNGGATDTEVVPVDEPQTGPAPFFYNTYIDSPLDMDQDGYYEAWSFEFDVDVPDGGTAETNILIQDNYGGDYGWFGPFTFVNGNVDDNVILGEFLSDWYSGLEGIPGPVTFTFTLSNGGDQMSLDVPVDGVEAGMPYFYTIYLDNPVDMDQDGYFESFGFEIDVDVPNGGTADVMIHMWDDQGHDHGWFGPFTFTGYNVDDNAFIGPFSAGDFNDLGFPVDMDISFQLDPGGDMFVGWIPVDDGTGGAFRQVPIQGNVYEMVSVGVMPDDPAVSSVFGSLEDLVIVYRQDGAYYIPGTIDNIVNVEPGVAYRVFSSFDDMWETQGTPVNTDTMYSLDPDIWNWLGYPFGYMMPVADAMMPMEESLEIIINDEGGFYIPGLINTLGVLRPNDGYMAFVNSHVDFVYPGGGPNSGKNAGNVVEIATPADAPERTGMPYIVLVNLSDDLKALNPATVEVYDGTTLAGKAFVQNDLPVTPVVTWQGAENLGLEGFRPGSPAQVVLKGEDGSTIDVRSTGRTVTFGEGAYGQVSLESAPMPTRFGMGKGYPNPFNPSVNIPFALPDAGEVRVAVYNVLGRQVMSRTRTFEAGYHHMVFNSNEAGQELVSGVYFIRMQYKGVTMTQKVVLMK